jgi:hypothetical protein
VSVRLRRLLIACALALAGCGHVLLEGSFTGENDAWALQVTELRDGPNTFKVNSVLFFPENGTKFLWARVTVKNNAAIRRTFDYKSCFLDVGQYGVPATMIAWSLMTNNYGISMRADFDPGEEKERYLGFAYPTEYLPTLIACGSTSIRVVIRLPALVPERR